MYRRRRLSVSDDKPRLIKRKTRHPVRGNVPTEKVLLSHLFEATPDGNVVVDEKSNIVLVNQRTEELFGYTKDELIGMPVEQLVPEAQRLAHREQHDAFMRNPVPRPMAERQSLLLKLTARRKDGSLFPVEITLNPIHSGPHLYVLCIVRDITWRRERERESREQAGLVHLLQEVATASNEADSISAAFQFTLDRLCQYLEWPLGHALIAESDSLLTPTEIWSGEIAGQYKVFEAVSNALRFQPGMGLPGIVLEQRQPLWMNNLPDHKQFARAREAREAGLHTAMCMPVMAGKVVVAALEFFHAENVRPDPNLMAVLPHIGVQLGRVIERKRAEEALRKQAAQLRMVMNNLPVILWVTDPEGKLILLEGKGVPAAGIQTAELLGKNLLNQVGIRSDLQEMIQRALDGEQIHTEIDSNTGAVFESFFMPYFDPDASIEGMIGLSFDISERKRMENELDEMKRRLLESTDVERARLAQQLHDGPLQDLYGAFYQIQEVRSVLEDEEGQEVASRVLQTIQGVNATLRVICGELHPNTLIHLGLQRAIRGHAERLQERLGEVEILLDLSDDTQGIESSIPHKVRLGLYRVYQQLITNAARHADAKHIWVRLRLPTGEVVLEVQDNGRGFEVPTHWIDLLRDGKYGLANALERVRSMEGRLEVNSHPGMGTLARVHVPLHPREPRNRDGSADEKRG